MTEKATNTNRINFYEEKKWIMAYWFKARRNINFSENQMLTQWSIWWKEDFGSSSGQIFQLSVPCQKLRLKQRDMRLQILVPCRHILSSWRAEKAIT